MNKKNLTIRQFEILIEDVGFKEELMIKIKLSLKKTKFCRDWRNRRVAHTDLDLSLKRSAKALKMASRKKVIEAIKSIDDVLNAVSYYYKKSTTAFNIGNSYRGATDLLYYLNYGLKKDNEKEERIRKGNYTEEDFKVDDF